MVRSVLSTHIGLLQIFPQIFSIFAVCLAQYLSLCLQVVGKCISNSFSDYKAGNTVVYGYKITQKCINLH